MPLTLVVPALVAAAVVGGSTGTGWWFGTRRVGRAGDKRARLLVELVGEAMAIPDDVGAADDVVRRVGEALDADAAAVGLVSGNALCLFGMWGYGPQIRTSRLAPGEGLSGQAWITGRPMVVDDVERMPHYVAGAPGIRSGAYVPGRLADRVVAVLAVESTRPAAYDANALRLIQPVADLLATMLTSRRVLRDAAELEDRLLPLIDREVRPALAEAVAALGAAGQAASPAERRRVVQAGLRSGRRLQHLLESVLLAARVGAGTEAVRPEVLPLSRVVATAVAAAGVDDRVDVAVPIDLRVIADERHLVHALWELLVPLADGQAGVRATIAARRIADEVNVDLVLPRTEGLRPHVARRLVDAMGGRLEPGWPQGFLLALPPARSAAEPVGLLARPSEARR